MYRKCETCNLTDSELPTCEDCGEKCLDKFFEDSRGRIFCSVCMVTAVIEEDNYVS